MKQILVTTIYTLQPDGSVQVETQVQHDGTTAAPPPTSITKQAMRGIVRPLIVSAINAERTIRDDARTRGHAAVEADKERALQEVVGFRDAVDAL